jgi:hypothetical protein
VELCRISEANPIGVTIIEVDNNCLPPFLLRLHLLYLSAMKHIHILKIGFYIVGFFTVALGSAESVYVYFFKKPIFVHFYISRKVLTRAQKSILIREVSFYRNLNNTHQSYFEHRLVRFIERYEFIGRDGFTVTDRSKVLIGAVYVMMTFGMRTYLTNVFSKIIIYPKAFMSIANKRMHKGEFNPMLRIVVFSWKDFQEGIDIKNDNLHLGIHEFAHVLSIHAKKSSDFSAKIFLEGKEELLDYLTVQKNVNYIKNLGYIRKYAFTNLFEFVAVLLEYFFESPNQFRQVLPDLYEIVKKMLNFRSEVP